MDKVFSAPSAFSVSLAFLPRAIRAMILGICLVAMPLTTHAANPVPEYTPQSPVPLGTPLPDFAVTGRDHSTFSRTDLAPNHPVLLFFFVPWSAISQSEAAQIATVAVMHPGVQIVPIGVQARATPDEVYDFPAAFDLQFAAYYDGGEAPADVTAPSISRSILPRTGTPGETQAAWGITGYPAVVVADRTGIVRAGHIGFLSAADLNAVVAGVESVSP